MHCAGEGHTMERGVQDMNHRYVAMTAVVVAAAFAGCGKKETTENQAEPTPAKEAGAAVAAEESKRILPEDVPDCPGTISAGEQTGDDQEGGAQILSSRPANEIVEHYTVRLVQDGWYVAASARQEDEYHFQFAKDRRTLRMQVATEGGAAAATRLRRAWGTAGAGEEELDSRPAEEEEEIEAPEPPSNEW